ncbi:MAG: ABC transporter permease [Peptococcaceae bacterium]|nr:ABC transporter permease [Peptococcaceae bacterium]
MIVIVYTVISKGAFIRPRNIRNILQSTTVVSLLTIGAGSLMIAGYLDLSLGGIGTMCAMLAAFLLRAGVPWYAALAAALILGGAGGAFNAVLVNELNFQPFIATLATASITQGFTSIISQGKQIDIANPVFNFIGSERVLDFIPYSLIISLFALLIYGVILKNTKFGRSVYLIGNNAQAARLAGLRPKRISYTLFINAGCLAALAGILLAARLKSSNTVGITNSQFAGMTAAILGGISLGGGTGGMGGALAGILILNCFNNGMTVIDVPPYWQVVASGILLLIALTADFLSARKRAAN